MSFWKPGIRPWIWPGMEAEMKAWIFNWILRSASVGVMKHARRSVKKWRSKISVKHYLTFSRRNLEMALARKWSSIMKLEKILGRNFIGSYISSFFQDPSPVPYKLLLLLEDSSRFQIFRWINPSFKYNLSSSSGFSQFHIWVVIVPCCSQSQV